MKYACVNKETNMVENVVVCEDLTKWKPPERCRVVPVEWVGPGDKWDEDLGDFVRPMSLLKPPMDEVAKKDLLEAFNAKKEEFKAELLFVDPLGDLSA